MGTDPWFALRALGLSILILLTAGIPTLVLAQNNELKWESAPGFRANFPLLFIWGTLTLATVRRIYAGLYKRTKELDPADLATMPSEGKPLGNAIWGYIEALSSKKGLSIPDWRALLNKPERVTHDTPYTLDPDWKEDLTRILGQVILRFDELETMHEGHLDTIESVSEKLRDLMALPDEETLENMLQHTEELLKFAKGIKREFNEWFPNETNTTLENVIKKLEEHFQAASNIEEEERSRWEAALRTCLPKVYHQKRPQPGQEPLIPSLWASAVQACLDTADAAAQKVRDQVALLSQQITAWEQIGRTTQYNNNIVSPDTAAPIIAKWKARADYGPLFSWMKISAAEQDKVLSGQQLKETMEAAMVAWLDQTNQIIPDTYRDTKTEDFADRLNNSILQLKKGINRMSKYMSGITSHAPGLSESDSKALDTVLDSKYRLPHLGTGYTPDQLREIIEDLQKDLKIATKKPAPSGRAPCTHPEDLSHILTGNDQQNWTDSLTQVQDLITASRNPPPAPPGGNNQEERLFSTNDVPKLTDDDDYWTYRRSFEIFANAATVAPHQLATAMARIQNRFEGKRRSYIMAYDFNNNLQPTWTATWRALLKYMDARFLDRDAHLELYKKWLTLRAKDTLWGQEFIAEFDRIRMTLNQIAPLQGKTTITDDKSLERLMDKLPKRVRDEVRYKHPNAEYQLMDDTDATTLGDVYDWVIDEWKHLHNTGQLEQSKNAPKKSSGGSKASDGSTSNRSPNANSPPRSPGSSSHPVWGTCNKPCWDSETIVPNGYRGPYMGIQRGRDNICPRCRRGKNEHGGHPDGCQHYGAHHWHDKPASRSSDPSGNDTGDN